MLCPLTAGRLGQGPGCTIFATSCVSKIVSKVNVFKVCLKMSVNKKFKYLIIQVEKLRKWTKIFNSGHHSICTESKALHSDLLMGTTYAVYHLESRETRAKMAENWGLRKPPWRMGDRDVGPHCLFWHVAGCPRWQGEPSPGYNLYTLHTESFSWCILKDIDVKILHKYKQFKCNYV